MEIKGVKINLGDMLYHIEETHPDFINDDEQSERWIGNKPIQGFTKTHILCGWGISVPLFTLDDFGKICHTDKMVVENLLEKKQLKR